MTKRLLSLLLLGWLLLPLHALAHNVIGGVYAIGDQIEGEIGFSNGDMAHEGTLVRISDGNGRELGQVTTDAEGFFVFTATERVEHHFFADLGAGHVVEMVLPLEQLPVTLAGSGSSKPAEPTKNGTTSNAEAVDLQQLQPLIEQAVARQVAPLRKELAAYKEKASLQDVLGGIGYIFGLCGLGIWLRHRQTASGGASSESRDNATGA
ncbi:hypothetical protein [Motiliproteus coralliicola]|uniref:hypothetical protein n=1 Tax=Motiliproteus coralliicola TaxID=2283196 RepID=UPI001A9CEA71|nr:hypothetical protein [Motiliproteus coralliicola]